MPAGSARGGRGSRGEGILHFAAVRMRLIGTGELDMQFRSLQGVKTQDLVPFTMTLTTDIEPTRLCNFKSQRAYLRVSTDEFQEYFRINRIIVFTNQLWTSFPG